MISLISDITDAKGSRAERGWVFFDRDCAICMRLAKRYRGTLEARGFGLAALQDPRATSLLGLPVEELLREMRVVRADGSVLGGTDAVVYLAGRIWWAWPVYAAARWLGARPLLVWGYRWFAAHRRCAAERCDVGTAISSEEVKVRAKGAGR